MLTKTVTQDNLDMLVVHFYVKVLEDELIGPIFADVLGEDITNDTWQEHMGIISSFWAAIALGDKSYGGNPFAPHARLADRLSIKAFERWLKLFFETLNTIYEPEVAQQFLARAKNVAGNFIRNLRLT